MFLLVCHGATTTSVYRNRFWVILKSYQFTVRINVFGEMLAYCCDTETTYQSFLWFYTSLRDHYNSGGKQSYSTLLHSIFFHHGHFNILCPILPNGVLQIYPIHIFLELQYCPHKSPFHFSLRSSSHAAFLLTELWSLWHNVQYECTV